MASFDLDDSAVYPEIDRSNMRSQLLNLPDQLRDAWEKGMVNALPELNGITNVVLAGMDGTAIGADLLAAYVADVSICPVHILREYQLPFWAEGKKTLVVTSSHSGKIEEELSVFDQALQQNCSLMVISTDGAISKRAQAHSIPLWNYSHTGQPMAAVGYSFGLSLALLNRLKLIPDQDKTLMTAVVAMEKMIQSVDIEISVKQNPAKRMAGQMLNRWMTIVGADHLVPVAKRYKSQINELSKALAHFELLPEIGHSILAGIVSAEDMLSKAFVLFLSGSFIHPSNCQRINLTRMEFLKAGINSDVVEINEENKLAEMWSSLVFGDFLSYYLAIAYQVDPTPIDEIQNQMRAMG